MVQVLTCCCCCSLTQGTVGTGIVSAIESILYIWSGINWINAGKDGDYHDDEEINDAVKSVLHTMGVISVVIGSLLLLITFVLFCGVSTKKRSLIIPWLIMRGILLGFQIYGMYTMFRSGYSFLYILGNILWICLMVYLFIVVYSYSKSLMRPVRTREQVMAPADKASFRLIPLNPENPHQPPVGELNYPPIYSPIPNPTGQQMYPAAPYGLQSQQTYPAEPYGLQSQQTYRAAPYGLQLHQPMGAPPAYRAASTVPADEP